MVPCWKNLIKKVFQFHIFYVYVSIQPLIVCTCVRPHCISLLIVQTLEEALGVVPDAISIFGHSTRQECFLLITWWQSAVFNKHPSAPPQHLGPPQQKKNIILIMQSITIRSKCFPCWACPSFQGFVPWVFVRWEKGLSGQWGGWVVVCEVRARVRAAARGDGGEGKEVHP